MATGFCRFAQPAKLLTVRPSTCVPIHASHATRRGAVLARALGALPELRMLEMGPDVWAGFTDDAGTGDSIPPASATGGDDSGSAMQLRMPQPLGQPRLLPSLAQPGAPLPPPGAFWLIGASRAHPHSSFSAFQSHQGASHMDTTCPLSAFFISSTAALGRVDSSPGRSPTSAGRHGQAGKGRMVGETHTRSSGLCGQGGLQPGAVTHICRQVGRQASVAGTRRHGLKEQAK